MFLMSLTIFFLVIIIFLGMYQGVSAGHKVLQLLGLKLGSKPNRTLEPYPNDRP